MNEPNDNAKNVPGRVSPRLLIGAAMVAWIAILAFLWLVWPTPHLAAGPGHRVNRLTGQRQAYDSDHKAWKTVKRRDRNTPVTSSGSESPVGGSHAASGNPGASRPVAHEEGWWYQDSKEAPKGKDGDQWWYEDKPEGREPQGKGDSAGWWKD